MESITITLEVEWITFAFQRLQSTTSTKMVTRVADTYTALSTNSRLTHSRKVFKTMIHLALSALSSHVVRCWWCLQGTIAPLDGPRNIMGTWWVHIIPTRSKVISSALTKTLSLSLAARRTRMVHYSTLWRDSVAAYGVVHMSVVESWLVLCAASERKNFFLLFFKGQNVIFKMNCIDLKTYFRKN